MQASHVLTGALCPSRFFVLAAVFIIFAIMPVARAALPETGGRDSTDAAASEGTVNSRLHALEFIAPAQRWAVRLELRSNGYDRIYDSDGKRQPLGGTLDNLNLDASLLPALAALGPGASLGTTAFSARVEAQRVELTLGYGIDDNLTVGLILPFGRVITHADFSIRGGNVGFNPGFDPSLPVGPGNSPLLPVGLGATEPVGTQGVQKILSDPAFGYAYQPLGDTRWQGVGDPTAGFLWRFYRGRHDAMILGMGIRFGLAPDVDDDELLQVPLSDGSTDLRLRLEYYRDLGAGFDLLGIAAYTRQFEDSVTRRIPAPGALLATADSKEELQRKLGDYSEFDLGIGKSLGDWRFSATWHRYQKAADRYRSDAGSDTSALEANTRLYAHQWRAAVSWSGIRHWQSGMLPLPLIVQLEVQETYQAENFPDVRDIYLQLTSFF